MESNRNHTRVLTGGKKESDNPILHMARLGYRSAIRSVHPIHEYIYPKMNEFIFVYWLWLAAIDK